jgi:hypothetical protein
MSRSPSPHDQHPNRPEEVGCSSNAKEDAEIQTVWEEIENNDDGEEILMLAVVRPKNAGGLRRRLWTKNLSK